MDRSHSNSLIQHSRLLDLFTDTMQGDSQIHIHKLLSNFLAKVSFILSRYLIEDTLNAMNLIRDQTSSLSTSSLKNIACSINDELLQLQHQFTYSQWFRVTLA